jgi:hypothetical protein
MSNIINESFVLPCGQVIKNRICKAAMTERIAKGNNLAHQGQSIYMRDGQMVILASY